MGLMMYIISIFLGVISAFLFIKFVEIIAKILNKY